MRVFLFSHITPASVEDHRANRNYIIVATPALVYIPESMHSIM